MAITFGKSDQVRRVSGGVMISAFMLAAVAGTPVAVAKGGTHKPTPTVAPSNQPGAANASAGGGTTGGSNTNAAGAKGAANAAAGAGGGAAGNTPAIEPAKPRPTPKLPSVLPPSDPSEHADGQANGEEALVVDLHVNDEDLGNVLEMLSLQSKRNIIASKGVSARVTANLYGVTFYEALDAILHANGYGYIEKGNFIYIYTLEELDQIEKASRQVISKVIRLNYLNSTDAAEFVKPLLSETGQIKTNGKSQSFPSIGEVPVGADEFANTATLVIVDFEENVAEIEKMVRELDTKPAQVLVEATILQTRLNEANAFGVDFSLLGSLNALEFANIGGRLKAADALITGTTQAASTGGTGTTGTSQKISIPADNNANALTVTPGNTAGPGTLKFGYVKGDVGAFLRILDEVTDTMILSNPKVLALNRMPARVLVGRKVGYISTTSTDTATTQTVQFLDTGTQLYFRPFVTNEGKIRLELRPSVSEASIRDVKDATGAAVTIPDEITNQLTTNLIVNDGQTIVLGGLFRESTSATRRQVPVLGDIPIVGAAFRGNEDATQRDEIIFLVTPTIMNDEVLTAQGQRGTQFVDRVRTGARAGLLPWSRDRLTGSWNVEAERLAAEGNSDRAQWKLRQSLWLNPQQPDAIALQEKVSGKKTDTAGRSMLDEIIHGEGVVVGKRRASMDATYTQPEAPRTIPAQNNTYSQASTNPFTQFQGQASFNTPQEPAPSAQTQEPEFPQTSTRTPSNIQANQTPANDYNPFEQTAPQPSTYQPKPQAQFQAKHRGWQSASGQAANEGDGASDNWAAAHEQDINNAQQGWNQLQGQGEQVPGQGELSANTQAGPGVWGEPLPQTEAPEGSSAGFFLGALRWMAAFHSFMDSPNSGFTSVPEEPMTENR